jgi:SagB-type dehydrogenase family enzyme
MVVGKNPEPILKAKKVTHFTFNISEYSSLPRASNKAKPLFFDILTSRKSERSFLKINILQLGSLLWHSAKFKKATMTKDGQLLLRRNNPSAGSIHAIDFFISLPGKKRNLFYYDPFIHRLAKLELNKTLFTRFINDINKRINCTNATIVWFGVYPAIVESKYRFSESLIWREAGVLLMTVQLTATALNLKSCPVGTLGEPHFSKLVGNGIIGLGGILIGQ